MTYIAFNLIERILCLAILESERIPLSIEGELPEFSDPNLEAENYAPVSTTTVPTNPPKNAKPRSLDRSSFT